MEQAQSLLQNVSKDRQRRIVARSRPDFRHLQVPIAVFPPQEVMDLPLSLTKLELLHIAVDVGHRRLQASDNPSVLKVLRCRWPAPICTAFGTLDVGHHEARCVPNLIGEIAARLHLRLVEAHIVARRVTRRQGKSQRVSTIDVHKLQGIEHVAFHLAHLDTRGIKNHPVEVDRLEGDVAGVLDARHDHPSNPEKDNIKTGN